MLVPVGLAVREKSPANRAMAQAGTMANGNADVAEDEVRSGVRSATEQVTLAGDNKQK